MPLSNDLIREFVKSVTPKQQTTSNASTAYGTIVDYNGSKWVRIDGSELLTPFTRTTNVNAGERVTVTIKDHTATVTGNLSSPSARTGDVVEVDSKVSGLEVIIADKVSVEYLEANYATIGSLAVTNAKIENLDATYAKIEYLDATYAKIEDLSATNATIENLDAKFATIENLEAANANIGHLQADFASIDALIFGSASGDVISTNFANAVIAQLGNAQIKSAMIDSISAGKITAGDIITNNVRVLSEDGSLLISDETIQISDENRVRVQIGKDAANDYSINIWDADGNLMFSEGGITEGAVKSAIIRNDMVSATANISASKLDIDSLFTEINGSSNTIKSTKIYLDDKDQTLDVAFETMTTTMTGQGEIISSQGTQITTIQGQINSKIWQQDIETAKNALNEDISILSTKYSTLEQTLDGFQSTVSSTYATKSSVNALTTRVNQTETSITSQASSISSLGTRVSTVEQTADGLVVRINDVETDIESIEVGGTNLLTNSSFSKNLSGWTVSGASITTIDGVTCAKIEGAFGKTYTVNQSILPKLDVNDLTQEYTYSADVRIDNYVAGTTNPYVRLYFSGSTGSVWLGSTTVSGDNDISKLTSGKWTRMTFVVKFASKPAAMSAHMYARDFTGTLYFKNLKLEKGNKATDWSPAPEDVDTSISNAAKTATNYLNFSNSGLVVGDMTASTLGKNVLIDSDSVDIRNGSTVLASFGASTIELGKNNKSSVISLCGGMGTITASNVTINNKAFDALSIESTTIALKCKDFITSTSVDLTEGRSIKSILEFDGFTDTTGISNTTAYIGARGLTNNAAMHLMSTTDGASRVYIYTTKDNSDGASIELLECGIEVWADALSIKAPTTFTSNAAFKNGIEIADSTPYIDFHYGNSTANYTSRIVEQSSGVLTVTGGLKVGDILDLQSAVKLRNGYQIKMAESDGTLRDVMYLGTSNNFIIGNGVSGNTNIYSGSGAVQLYVSADRVQLRNATDTANYTAHFLPGTNGKVTLGVAANRWHSVYAANASIQTSDAREKENIFALNDVHEKLFDRLQPVQFNYINTPSRICYGLIAQEVAEVMDELGIGEDELDLVHHDYWIDEETNESKESYGLAYNNLIAMLIHEVQKLKREVAALKTV